MKKIFALVTFVLALFAFTLPAYAGDDESEKKEEPKKELQFYRQYSSAGKNIFEPAKFEKQPKFNGMFSKIGFGVTQQIQNLKHEHSIATPLYGMGLGANNAVANLYIHAQLADGIRFETTGYASARHHQEFWWKDGYIQIDKIPINHPLFEVASLFTRIKVGHQEINYGDAHFRRTDNGNSMFNPFVGNLILDAFTTEIGGEMYIWAHPNAYAMFSMTGAEVKGNLLKRELSKPAFIFKSVFDKQMTSELRLRGSFSRYHNSSSPANTLYAGDRAGSRYYGVTEADGANLVSSFSSGIFNPGFSNAVTANMFNTLVSFKGLEFFGTYEFADGENFAKDKGVRRDVKQYAGDFIYRFNALGLNTYLAARRNVVEGELLGITNPVNVSRWQLATGFNLTPNILMKAEYVNQIYKGYPAGDHFNGMRFHGFVVESGVTF